MVGQGLPRAPDELGFVFNPHRNKLVTDSSLVNRKRAADTTQDSRDDAPWDQHTATSVHLVTNASAAWIAPHDGTQISLDTLTTHNRLQSDQPQQHQVQHQIGPQPHMCLQQPDSAPQSQYPSQHYTNQAAGQQVDSSEHEFVSHQVQGKQQHHANTFNFQQHPQAQLLRPADPTSMPHQTQQQQHLYFHQHHRQHIQIHTQNYGTLQQQPDLHEQQQQHEISQHHLDTKQQQQLQQQPQLRQNTHADRHPGILLHPSLLSLVPLGPGADESKLQQRCSELRVALEVAMQELVAARQQSAGLQQGLATRTHQLAVRDSQLGEAGRRMTMLEAHMQGRAPSSHSGVISALETDLAVSASCVDELREELEALTSQLQQVISEAGASLNAERSERGRLSLEVGGVRVLAAARLRQVEEFGESQDRRQAEHTISMAATMEAHASLAGQFSQCQLNLLEAQEENQVLTRQAADVATVLDTERTGWAAAEAQVQKLTVEVRELRTFNEWLEGSLSDLSGNSTNSGSNNNSNSGGGGGINNSSSAQLAVEFQRQLAAGRQERLVLEGRLASADLDLVSARAQIQDLTSTGSTLKDVTITSKPPTNASVLSSVHQRQPLQLSVKTTGSSGSSSVCGSLPSSGSSSSGGDERWPARVAELMRAVQQLELQLQESSQQKGEMDAAISHLQMQLQTSELGKQDLCEQLSQSQHLQGSSSIDRKKGREGSSRRPAVSSDWAEALGLDSDREDEETLASGGRHASLAVDMRDPAPLHASVGCVSEIRPKQAILTPYQPRSSDPRRSSGSGGGSGGDGDRVGGSSGRVEALLAAACDEVRRLSTLNAQLVEAQGGRKMVAVEDVRKALAEVREEGSRASEAALAAADAVWAGKVAAQQHSLTAAQDALDAVHDLLTTARQDLATATTEYEESYGSHAASLQAATASHAAAVADALVHDRTAQDAAWAATAATAAAAAASAEAAAAREDATKAADAASQGLAAAVAAGAEAVKGAVAAAAAAAEVVATVHEMQLEHAGHVAEELRGRLTEVQLELAQVCTDAEDRVASAVATALTAATVAVAAAERNLEEQRCRLTQHHELALQDAHRTQLAAHQESRDLKRQKTQLAARHEASLQEAQHAQLTSRHESALIASESSLQEATNACRESESRARQADQSCLALEKAVSDLQDEVALQAAALSVLETDQLLVLAAQHAVDTDRRVLESERLAVLTEQQALAVAQHELLIEQQEVKDEQMAVAAERQAVTDLALQQHTAVAPNFITGKQISTLADLPAHSLKFLADSGRIVPAANQGEAAAEAATYLAELEHREVTLQSQLCALQLRVRQQSALLEELGDALAAAQGEQAAAVASAVSTVRRESVAAVARAIAEGARSAGMAGTGDTGMRAVAAARQGQAEAEAAANRLQLAAEAARYHVADLETTNARLLLQLAGRVLHSDVTTTSSDTASPMTAALGHADSRFGSAGSPPADAAASQPEMVIGPGQQQEQQQGQSDHRAASRHHIKQSSCSEPVTKLVGLAERGSVDDLCQIQSDHSPTQHVNYLPPMRELGPSAHLHHATHPLAVSLPGSLPQHSLPPPATTQQRQYWWQEAQGLAPEEQSQRSVQEQSQQFLKEREDVQMHVQALADPVQIQAVAKNASFKQIGDFPPLSLQPSAAPHPTKFHQGPLTHQRSALLQPQNQIQRPVPHLLQLDPRHVQLSRSDPSEHANYADPLPEIHPCSSPDEPCPAAGERSFGHTRNHGSMQQPQATDPNSGTVPHRGMDLSASVGMLSWRRPFQSLTDQQTETSHHPLPDELLLMGIAERRSSNMSVGSLSLSSSMHQAPPTAPHILGTSNQASRPYVQEQQPYHHEKQESDNDDDQQKQQQLHRQSLANLQQGAEPLRWAVNDYDAHHPHHRQSHHRQTGMAGAAELNLHALTNTAHHFPRSYSQPAPATSSHDTHSGNALALPSHSRQHADFAVPSSSTCSSLATAVSFTATAAESRAATSSSILVDVMDALSLSALHKERSQQQEAVAARHAAVAAHHESAVLQLRGGRLHAAGAVSASASAVSVRELVDGSGVDRQRGGASIHVLQAGHGGARELAGDALERELLMRRHSHAGAIPDTLQALRLSVQHDQRQQQLGRVRFSWDTSQQQELTLQRHQVQQQQQYNVNVLAEERDIKVPHQQYSHTHELRSAAGDKSAGSTGGITLKDFSLASLASLSEYERSRTSHSGGSVANPRYSAGH